MDNGKVTHSAINKMINWNQEQLKKLQEFYQEEYNEAEGKINDSSYPPDEELQMEKSQSIIWLLKDMMDEKSWIYKLCNNINKQK